MVDKGGEWADASDMLNVIEMKSVFNQVNSHNFIYCTTRERTLYILIAHRYFPYHSDHLG